MSLIILRFLKRKRVETIPLSRFGDQMLLQLRVEIGLVYSEDMINRFCWKLRIIGALRKMSLLSKFKKVNFCTCIIHIHTKILPFKEKYNGVSYFDISKKTSHLIINTHIFKILVS